MKSNFFKLLLAIACLLSSTSVFAYDFEVDGIYYDVISFTDFTCKVVSGDTEYEGDIVIPATVNYSNRTLTVVEVGYYAFLNCLNLTGIAIPNTVISVGKGAFDGCSSLMHVTIGNSVETISDSAFNGCSSLTEVKIPDSVETIGDYAFYRCSSLTNVTIGNSVKTISSSAFEGCSSLTEVKIPDSVETIGEFAFEGCSSLTSVTIGNSVTEIGIEAFYNCFSLASVTIPNSVTTIGENAFSGCSSLTDVIIADGEETLNNFSTADSTPFIYCPIEKLYLGRDINSYFSMFRDMTSLTSLTIGNSVTRIGTSLFAACNNLMELYILNSTPPSVGGNNFTNNHYLHANVYVPQEALEAYQSADTWKNFWNLQGFDATGIGSVKPTNENGKAVYYDLSGRRLNTPRHGLNIVNGKKVMVQ